jgi:hypothetical protein
MATEFYKLIDENANELILDQNFLTMKIGKTSRRLSVSEYAGRSGGIVRGFGLYKPKTITFGRKDKLTASGQSSFNTTRLAFQKWATKSRTTTVYFQVTVSDTATNYKAECVPLEMGPDNYSRHYAITDLKTMTIVIPGGVLPKTSTDSQAYTYTTADATESFTATNAGIVEVFPVIKFTPTNNATYLDVKTADNFGVRLVASPFVAGSQIVYDTSDNSLTLGGAKQATRQYLDSGSSFFLKEGANTIYLTSDSAGSASIEWIEAIV